MFTVIDSSFCKELQIQTDFNRIWKTWLRILTFSLWNDAEPPGWCLPSSAVVTSPVWLVFSNTQSPAPAARGPGRPLAAKWRPGSAGRQAARWRLPPRLRECWAGKDAHTIFLVIPIPLLLFLSWFWYPINRKSKSDSCCLKWNGKVIYTAIFLQDVVSCSKHSIKPLTNFSGA